MSAGQLTKETFAEPLERLLEPVPVEEFLASSWGQRHAHIRGWPGKFAHLLPWDRLNRILRQHRLDFPRLRLVLDGKSVAVSSYLRHVTGGRRKTSIPRLQTADFTAQLRQGATLVLDAVDELHEPLTQLAEGLELLFHEHVQVNTYASWHTSRGFDLHWDDHDVLVLQVAGRKRWSVYGMTRAHPFMGDAEPVPRPAPENPLWEATLEDGDLLYIPRGWWHVALPLDEPTLHLTVGIHKRTGLDLMRWLTERLGASEIFRRDLPRFMGEAERAAHMLRLGQELSAMWDAELLENFFAEQDQKAEPRPLVSLPWSPTAGALPRAADARVRLLAPRPLDFRLEDGTLEFSCLRKRWRLDGRALPVLRLLEERRECGVRELCESMKEELDERTVRALLGELLEHGLVAIVEALA